MIESKRSVRQLTDLELTNQSTRNQSAIYYFVNKPLPWYVVLSYTSPRLRNCPKSEHLPETKSRVNERLRTIWKPRDCINSIQHTTEVVYSFYDSVIIFHHKQTDGGGGQGQAHVICHGFLLRH